jgi:hypothetical protein
MLFTDLQLSLLESLRARIKNGELTERGLARLVGASQPHIHNVLKGARFLSPSLADRILEHLDMSVFDLVDREQLAQYLTSDQHTEPEYTYVPVLDGILGPRHPWPSRVNMDKLFAVPTSQLAAVAGPVVVRLAEDVRMPGVFDADSFALLDQSLHARCAIEPNALYAVKRGNTGALRRLRTVGRDVYIVAEDCLQNPAAWERIRLEHQHIQHVVRAKATLLAKEIDWIA